MKLAHQHPTSTTEIAHRDQAPVEQPEAPKRTDLVRIAAVAIAVVWAWFHPWSPLGRLDLIGEIAALVGGYPIFREAVEALLARRMTVGLSMTIAIVEALGMSGVFMDLVVYLFVVR